jgi:hypothetical protein
LADLTIQDCNSWGIICSDVHNYDNSLYGIINCKVSYNSYGIFITDCQDFRVHDTHVHDNDFGGMKVRGSQNCVLESSTSTTDKIEDNGNYGISIDDTGITQEIDKSYNILIDEYHILDNDDINIEIKNIDRSSAEIELSDLKIDGNTDYHFTNVEITNSGYITICGSDTEIFNGDYGIYMYECEEIEIDCDITDLSTSANGNFHDNGCGIFANKSELIKISEIHAIDNTYEGGSYHSHICLIDCDNFYIGGDGSDTNYIGLESCVDYTYAIWIKDCDDTSGTTGWIKGVEIVDTTIPSNIKIITIY